MVAAICMGLPGEDDDESRIDRPGGFSAFWNACFSILVFWEPDPHFQP